MSSAYGMCRRSAYELALLVASPYANSVSVVGDTRFQLTARQMSWTVLTLFVGIRQRRRSGIEHVDTPSRGFGRFQPSLGRGGLDRGEKGVGHAGSPRFERLVIPAQGIEGDREMLPDLEFQDFAKPCLIHR
ncbi:MAG: hypothetical protein KA191_08845 [Verrucomicrobia bacterium]|nr:hypothetical protein [Verrucomicrobiota bacterium]OQC63573.1 MAG: hypothetical protein BWX48_03133 [Verrucomicrobia bacterium ADurb.Bin006]NMD19124.1 hypothetical protein [Verrucomicrobiota bacterium]HOA60449.1 hypothetical protein [Verrucomicrobiota bacterium]HOF47779.1 hypothetical protein [Verrucomicrobiota bacterium]